MKIALTTSSLCHLSRFRIKTEKGMDLAS